MGGLFIEGLYQDNELIRKACLANDLVTMPITLLLVIPMLAQKHGDQRPMLVWMGVMLYMFYNYAFYLFGAKFNEFFLIYVALFSLSLYSIIIAAKREYPYDSRERLLRKGRRFISVFLPNSSAVVHC